MSKQPKNYHEIRDPIHVFVRICTDERKLVDTWPFQRLRYIHQLGTTYLVYPGATHRRFEHSLGVMELASRVFDVVTTPNAITDEIKKMLPQIINKEPLMYWRKVLRLAGLCHDLGHLPFSHAAEAKLLPDGWDHERLTADIIMSPSMRNIWKEMEPPIQPEHVVKLALGAPKAPNLGYELSLWESILSEVIVGDTFGVDRMDYLLRDSHHAGVVYGHFDHYRVIDTLRVLPEAASEEGEDAEKLKPTLGITEGGIHSADAMVLARYFMFSQLYFHPIRRIYDIHLKDFLVKWLEPKGGKFPKKVQQHLKITDNEVLSAIYRAYKNANHPAHDPARRIIEHDHFQVVYRRREEDVRVNPNAARAIYQALSSQFDENKLRYDRCEDKGAALEFPVQRDDGKIESSISVSNTLPKVPPITTEFVFADRDIVEDARQWLETNRRTTITPAVEN